MKQTLLLLFMALGLVACKENNEGADPSVIKGKIRKHYYNKNADQVRVFYYNKKAQLSHYEYHFNNIITERLEFNYDHNLLNSSKHFEVSNNNQVKTLYKTMFYNRDEKGRLKEITWQNFPDNPRRLNYELETNRIVYNYKDDNSDQFESQKQYNRKGDISSEYIFAYDNLGNVSTMDYFSFPEGIKTKSLRYVYEYSNHANPMYMLGDPTDEIANYSKQLISKSTYTNMHGETFVEYFNEFVVNEANQVIEYTLFTPQSGGGNTERKGYFEYY